MNEKVKKPVIFVFSTAYLPFIGGVEVAIEQVAKRLRNEFNFVIFTSRMRRDLPKMEMRDEGCVVRIGFGNHFDKFWLLFFGWFAVWRELRKQRRKIIFWVMDFSFGAAAAGILKILYPKIPLIFTIQYGYGDERVAKGRFGLMNLAFRLILLQSDYITAISHYLLNLCGQYGYIGEEAVIHNGVDLEKFTNQESRTENRVIISTSRRVYKNGLDILEKAFEIVKKTFPDTELKIVSDVPYDELPKYLWKASIFVRPSRSEGMGNAFVEALAAGVPIIGTPVGGILDIIKDGETGLFARVDDPKDLAEKIKILLKDKALARKIVENGKKMVEERFSWDKISRNYADVFNYELNLKKRILIATGIFPPEVGGPATYSKILLDELPENGFGVAVATYGASKTLPWLIRHALFGLRVFFMVMRHDVLYSQDAVNSGVVSAISAFVWRKKFILKIVGDYAWEQGVQRFGVKEVLDDFLKNKYRWEVELLRKIQKFAANRADKIIVPSEYLKGVVEKWGVRGEKICVVYNAFEPLENDYKKKAKEELFPDKVIVSAGRLVPWKGFDALIDIMPEILKIFPETKLFIIGDGPEMTKLEVKIKNRELAKQVFMLGKLSTQELVYYLFADVFVLNTAYEGFSHQILEAMAIGTPVITTKIGGNPELVEDGISGILVEFNDKEALTNSILKLLQDEKLAQKLSTAAVKKAHKFVSKRMIGDTIKIITNL